VARDTRREAVTRAAIGEISAAAQSARADLAATAEAVSAMPAQNDRLGELLTQGEQLIAGLQMKAAEEAEALQRARTAALEGVELAIGKMQMAAERLHAGAAAQEQALARVRRAALTVATLAGASSSFGEATIIEPDEAQAG
jgi:maltooligosyltrehalose synthase